MFYVGYLVLTTALRVSLAILKVIFCRRQFFSTCLWMNYLLFIGGECRRTSCMSIGKYSDRWLWNLEKCALLTSVYPDFQCSYLCSTSSPSAMPFSCGWLSYPSRYRSLARVGDRRIHLSLDFQLVFYPSWGAKEGTFFITFTSSYPWKMLPLTTKYSCSSFNVAPHRAAIFNAVAIHHNDPSSPFNNGPKWISDLCFGIWSYAVAEGADHWRNEQHFFARLILISICRIRKWQPMNHVLSPSSLW